MQDSERWSSASGSGEKLREALAPYEITKEVRGVGLLNGIELNAPKKLTLRALYEAFCRIHPAMFGQVLVMRMLREKNILTQMCGNNFMVLKAAHRWWSQGKVG